MKKLLAISSLVVLGGFAQAKEEAAKAKTAKCDAKACCDAGCSGTTIKLAVAGLEKESTAATAQVKIGAMAGINKCGTCSKSGTVMVTYDPQKMTVADIEKAVAANGLKVTGHKTSMMVKGLACQSCSNHLTSVLGKTEGVVNVDKVCHKSGTVAVTFDPKKTDMEKIKASIHTTKYKVVENKGEACEGKECKKAATPPAA